MFPEYKQNSKMGLLNIFACIEENCDKNGTMSNGEQCAYCHMVRYPAAEYLGACMDGTADGMEGAVKTILKIRVENAGEDQQTIEALARDVDGAIKGYRG